jgi:hypothetical protein
MDAIYSPFIFDRIRSYVRWHFRLDGYKLRMISSHHEGCESQCIKNETDNNMAPMPFSCTVSLVAFFLRCCQEMISSRNSSGCTPPCLDMKARVASFISMAYVFLNGIESRLDIDEYDEWCIVTRDEPALSSCY